MGNGGFQEKRLAVSVIHRARCLHCHSTNLQCQSTQGDVRYYKCRDCQKPFKVGLY